MKKTIFYLLISLSLILITGCTENYDRKDIINYVNEELKITDIKVSKTHKEIIDKEGYTDKIWTVLDKENNITFHVLDDFYYGMESVTNNLSNDYDESVFIELYNEIDVKQNIVYNYKNNNLINEVNLVCNYNNKEELNECYTSLLSYKNYIEEQNYNLAISYALEYNFPLKTIGKYESNLGTTVGTLNNIDQNVYNQAMYDYLSTALMFQIDKGVNEITKADMDNILENEETHLIFIKRNNGNKEQYNDIIAHPYYGISFGTLYKILEKEGLNPNGNPWHYTVTNKNGDELEFSYDFNDYVYEDDKKGYYYKKNGKKINMDAYFYNSFRDTQINEMFGIEIEETAKRFLYN